MRENKFRLISLVIFIGVVVFSDSSFAVVPESGALDSMMFTFKDHAKDWWAIMEFYALRLFSILAVIDFAWMAIMLALSLGDFQEFVVQVVRKIIVLGLFMALLVYGHIWASQIVESLVQAGGQANQHAGGATSITPSNIFDTGFQVCAMIASRMSVFNPGESLVFVIGGFLIICCFALIAAQMLLIYVQSFVVLNAGVILLGFGGLSFTREITLKYFQAALSIGAKLFVMILVVGLCQNVMADWVTGFTIDLRQIYLFVGASMVMLALVKAIPDMVGDLINGFSWGAGEPLSRAMVQGGSAVASATLAAATGGAGAVMAVTQAAKLSHSGSGSFTGNLAAAIKDDISGRLTGENRGFGTMGGRMAESMKKTSEMKSDPPIIDKPYISGVAPEAMKKMEALREAHENKTKKRS